MKISCFCENNISNKFIFSCEEIEEFAKSLLNYALNTENISDFSLQNDYEPEILICDNVFIHNINREYRKKDMPTDVITFALYADSDEKIIFDNTISLGQIIISADKVFEQAKDNNVKDEFEFLNLLSHGILHLIGFDHQDDESLDYMLNLQEKMIESVYNVKI